MLKLFTNATIYFNFSFVKKDFFIDDSNNFQFFNKDKHNKLEFDEVVNCEGLYAFPGFIDTHVHLREPGYSYKETIKTGTLAAAKGGYTHVFAMPNLNPAPTNMENLQIEKDLISQNAVINVYPVCSITKDQSGQGELSDITELSKDNKLFSDDGKGIQQEDLMRKAMKAVNNNNGYVLAHCEDEAELCGGSLNKGSISEKFNDPGINNKSEYAQIVRDLQLSKETGCNYHICHISTQEGVKALRQAKKTGKNVSGEVTCHHLFLNENDINQDNGKWKMNPPLRSKEDQQELISGLLDGTIDMICTDNAPHSKEEKDCPIKDALMGIVSNEIAFSLVYTNLVKQDKISLEETVKLMSTNAARLFNLSAGTIKENNLANICIYDLNENFVVDPKDFASKGKSCPFEGQELFGKCKMTICNGKIVYRENI